MKEGDETPLDIHYEPFSSAPAVYSFNIPIYFAAHIRAREYAKQTQQRLTWCYARDVPLHRDDRDIPEEVLQNKLAAWLQRHDQETCHLTGVLPLVKGLPSRLTDNVD